MRWLSRRFGPRTRVAKRAHCANGAKRAHRAIRARVGSAYALVAVLATACGPMERIMPPTLDEKSQVCVDRAWHVLLEQHEQVGSQQLLDVIVLHSAYQTSDHFIVQVLDPAGARVRTERYTRAQVEKTYADLAQIEVASAGAPPSDRAARATALFPLAVAANDDMPKP